MNNKIFFFLLFILFTFSVNAQIDGISYQAIIIDNNPQEIPGVDIPANNLPNASLEVKFTIINNSGVDEYQEIHITETDPFGMINLMIGQGDVSGGTANQFNQIYWSDEKTLLVEIDLKDGNGFVPFSEQSLTYIPYVKHREIVATSTLDVDGATNLNNTLNVNNGKTTTLTGDLYVEGTAFFTDGEFENLTVHQNTSLNLLNVDGISNFNNNVNVTQGSATHLSGSLNVDGKSTLNNSLTVTSTSPTTLSGTLDVDGITNHNNQVIIDADMPNSSQSQYSAYPLRVQGAQQGIAIQLNPDNPSRSNNYISFWGGTGEAKGLTSIGQLCLDIA